ncbi:MAG: multisubunit Na+/H+ antiporter MnhB subunit [Paraglaciecola sp.]|jgi:multisubunit Na+/H+ antiporter MnhB subunit
MFNKLDLEYHSSALDKNASWVISALSVGGLLFILISLLLNQEGHSGGLQTYVDDNINISGVTNPITAVLLNFRAYDTLLELAVLLIVAIAVLPTCNHNAALIKVTEARHHDLVLLALQRWIAPALTLFAGYLLWVGAFQPGGAFQAGALLAGTCVLLFQTGTYRVNYTAVIGRCLMAAGLAVFITVAVALIWFEGAFLAYPLDAASTLILLIEATATVSIAIALASLYSSVIEVSFSGSVDTHGRAV